MRSFRATTSPFKKREIYSDADFESICTDALKSVGVYPENPSPVRIERFIEKRFGLVPMFEDLKQYGAVGLTIFGKAGPTEMIIDNQLAGADEVTRARYLSTLAHEAGHCLLHTHLFALHSRKTASTCLCRHEGGKYTGEWWEYQANRAMGSLLLPEFIFKEHLKSVGIKKSADATDETLQVAATIFGVNKPVVSFRLKTLRF